MIKVDNVLIGKNLCKRNLNVENFIRDISNEIEFGKFDHPKRNFHRVINNSKLTEAVKAKYLPNDISKK